MIRSGRLKVRAPKTESGSRILMGSVDALKCIAWGGRALVVGFAGGAIEQVRTQSCCGGLRSGPKSGPASPIS